MGDTDISSVEECKNSFQVTNFQTVTICSPGQAFLIGGGFLIRNPTFAPFLSTSKIILCADSHGAHRGGEELTQLTQLPVSCLGNQGSATLRFISFFPPTSWLWLGLSLGGSGRLSAPDPSRAQRILLLSLSDR